MLDNICANDVALHSPGEGGRSEPSRPVAWRARRSSSGALNLSVQSLLGLGVPFGCSLFDHLW
jgi:hypothetical protein